MNHSASMDRKIPFQIGFFLILAITVLLRYLQLEKGYHSDEGWLLKASEVPLSKLWDFLTKGRSVYPPLTPLLLHLWKKISHSELWVRSYFVLFGVGVSVLTYQLGKTYLDRRFGFIAFFLSSFSPLLIWTSQFVRSYIDAAFWSILSLFFLLKMIQTEISWKNGTAYLIASSLAFYTSYISAFLLLAQTFFVLLFYRNNFRFLKRWFCLQLAIGLLSLPALFLIWKQIGLARAIDAGWSSHGFLIGPFNVGLYARSIGATLGLDPGFLTENSLSRQWPPLFLLLLSFLAVGGILWFVIRASKHLGQWRQAKPLKWFFPGMLVLSLIFYTIFVEWMHFPSQGEYFITHHILFLCLCAAFFYRCGAERKTETLLLATMVVIFSWRALHATMPEFETKKAYAFLKDKKRPLECVWMIRNTNYYLKKSNWNIFVISPFLKKTGDASAYNPLDQKTNNLLLKTSKQCHGIWFHRNYANDEILGANQLLLDWFKNNHYHLRLEKKFKRIDLLYYQ